MDEKKRKITDPLSEDDSILKNPEEDLPEELVLDGWNDTPEEPISEDAETNENDEPIFDEYEEDLPEESSDEPQEDEADEPTILVDENGEEIDLDDIEELKTPFWETIIPLRGDTVFELVRKCLVLLLALVFIISSVYIGNYFYQSYKNGKQNEELRNLFYSGEDVLVDGLFNTRFGSLIRQNPDTVGWLKVPGTEADNPVVQNKLDPSYYLTHNFYKGESEYGTIFADPKNSFTSDGLSQNTILYGHRMRDGSMLAGIKHYKELDFYKQNPVVNFTPIYTDGSNKWKVFAVILSDTADTDILGPNGPFNYLISDFEDDIKFNAFVDECYQRSIIKTTTQDVVPTDKLLTLSTCSYEFDDARLVVVCRQVRHGESEKVDVAGAAYNPKVVYPLAYLKSEGIDGNGSIVYNYKNGLGSAPTNSNTTPPNWAEEISAIYRTPTLPYVPSVPSSQPQSQESSYAEEPEEPSEDEPSEEVSSEPSPTTSVPPPESSEPTTSVEAPQ